MVSYLLLFFQTTMSVSCEKRKLQFNVPTTTENSDVNRSEKRDDGPERNLSVWNRTCSSPGRFQTLNCSAPPGSSSSFSCSCVSCASSVSLGGNSAALRPGGPRRPWPLRRRPCCPLLHRCWTQKRRTSDEQDEEESILQSDGAAPASNQQIKLVFMIASIPQ